MSFVRNAAIIACAVLALGACKASDKQGSDASTCAPATCATAGKNCGTFPDGCGGSIVCGTCTAPQTCGGGGTANLCGSGACTTTTCAAQNKNCGTISDGCSNVLNCGTCGLGEACGAGGTPNVCAPLPGRDGGTPDAGTPACAPTCMAQQGAECCSGCGCGGQVACYPSCDAPYQWDCEIQCCFNYTTLQCL